MQIAVMDIRRWGYNKISKYFYKDEKEKASFFIELAKLNSLNYDKKVSPYGFLNSWGSIKDRVDRYYQGMEYIVYDTNPFISNVKLDDLTKRKFRNTYESIMKNIGKDLNLSDSDIQIMSDLGLKLAYIDYDDSLLKIFTFYNTVLKWAFFTMQESNFSKNNLSFLSIISIMTYEDSEAFIKIINNSLV